MKFFRTRQNLIFSFLMILLFSFAVYFASHHPSGNQFHMPPSKVLYLCPSPAPVPSEPEQKDACTLLTSLIENDKTDPLLREQAQEMLLSELSVREKEKTIQNILDFQGFDFITCKVKNDEAFLFSKESVNPRLCRILFDLIHVQTGILAEHIYLIERL